MRFLTLYGDFADARTGYDYDAEIHHAYTFFLPLHLILREFIYTVDIWPSAAIFIISRYAYAVANNASYIALDSA